MIRYALRCSKAHEFEAWFRSIADYERAVAAGEAVCPVCGDTKVEKALMAPVGRRHPARAEAGKDEKVKLAAPDPRQQAMRETIKALRKQVTENADYVGDKFAEEARKIHYNEVEARGIYGEATGDEAQALADEGIDFLPLPSLPEDRN